MRDGSYDDGPGHVGIEAPLTAQSDNKKPQELKDVNMTLVSSDLWKKFFDVCTEMIITKMGRNMFPVVTVQVTGLDPDARYFIVMEISLSSERRFKFVGSEWKAAGKAEPQLPPNTRLYIHQDSPATGAHWMREPIRMKSAKLTNNPASSNGHVVLTSMHKYIPRIHVVKTSDIVALPWSPTATFMFPETEFIAVTAYQNNKVTKLKINNNPFAKGFRENGLSYAKRKHSETASSRKRPCCEQNSMPLVESTKKTPSSFVEESNSNEQKEAHIVPPEQNETVSLQSVDSPCEELASAITNININSSTLQYPYSAMYHSYFQHHYQEHQMWRFPYLFPPPPPLLSPFILPFPYYPSLFHSHQFLQSSPACITELNTQPYDYSVRDKSS